MAHYRLYLLDADNHIVQHADLEAADDATACVHASAGLASPLIVEIWCGVRRVRQIVGVL